MSEDDAKDQEAQRVEDLKNTIPSYWEYIPVTVEVLRKRGGSATVRELVAEVPAHMRLTPEQQTVPHDPAVPGRSEVGYRLAWTGTYLRKAGLIESPNRGVWSLTQKGRDSGILDGRALAREIRSTFEGPETEPHDPPTDEDVDGETYLFAWNPTRFDWSAIDDRIRSISEAGGAEDRWSCGSVKSIPPGSRFFLIRLGQEPKGLVGAGVTVDEVYEAPHYDAERAARGEKARFVPLRFNALSRTPLIARRQLDRAPLDGFRWDTQMSGVRIPRAVATALEAEWQARLSGTPLSGSHAISVGGSGSGLQTDDGLRAAAQGLTWSPRRTEWVRLLAEVLTWVRKAPEGERAERSFQQRLWEENEVAAVGQGNLPVDEAIAHEPFRRWLASRSMQPLPARFEERVVFLRTLFDDIKARLADLLPRKKTPRLKIFRVLAALYPDGMTTVASASALAELARAMGGDASLDSVSRHVWVRDRLDAALGPAGESAEELARRMVLPWQLYDEVVRKQEGEDESIAAVVDDRDEPQEMPLSKIIEIVNQAGYFEPGVVARLHAGLWANERRHFVVLTGLSGAGKTLLARTYARALAPSGIEAPLLIVPVQPGWHDPSPLLGYPNPLQSSAYVRTQFLQFLIAAASDPGRRYVVVLDEMNLSHPEQYLAPLLSAMETGERMQLHGEVADTGGVPASIAYPSNLALIGTVNMDETTHGLSDKVLDRAFVIDFWRVDLAAYPRWTKHGLSAKRLEEVRGVLAALMQALEPARLHFGWRVVDDVLEFLSELDGEDCGLSPTQILDAVVYAKILPKLRGEDSSRLRKSLEACQSALDSAGLTESSAKVSELRQDLEASGAARFWR